MTDPVDEHFKEFLSEQAKSAAAQPGKKPSPRRVLAVEPEPPQPEQSPPPTAGAPAPVAEPTQKDRVAELVKMLGELTPEEIEQAGNSVGAVLPVIPKGLNPEIERWAYRCMSCPTPEHPFRYAFEFSGDMFAWPDGTTRDKPPEGVPIEKIPWTQNKGTRKSFQRSAPVCQHCGNPVHLGPDGGIWRKRMIDIARHQREQAIVKEHMRKPLARRQIAYDAVGPRTAELNPNG